MTHLKPALRPVVFSHHLASMFTSNMCVYDVFLMILICTTNTFSHRMLGFNSIFGFQFFHGETRTWASNAWVVQRFNPAVWLRAALGRELPIKILRKCRYLRSLGLMAWAFRMACVLQIMILSIRETSVSCHVLKTVCTHKIYIYIYVCAFWFTYLYHFLLSI